MQCHDIILDTTGTTYTFCERDKTKETKLKEKQNRSPDKNTKMRIGHAAGDVADRFRTAVSFWGQTTQIMGSLSPKRDCSTKMVQKNDLRKLHHYI